MKTRMIKTLLIAVASIMYASSVWSQGIIVYKSDGTTERLSYAAIDSIVTYADYKEKEDKNEDNDDDQNKDELYEAVDLGLSVKWASCNVGASSPEQYGDYFAWGEVEPKSDYSKENYRYYNNDTKEYIYIGDDISGTEYDVVYVKWGDGWRMPTKEEVLELHNKCSWQRCVVNGVSGQMITGTNGNSIFIPAEENGIVCYFSGTYFKGGEGEYSYILYVKERVPDMNHINYRYFALPIRPVKE